jgi:formiminotetrahydrofolate cyclodeaminase
MGAALVAMVAELTLPRADTPQLEAELSEIRDQALARRQELLDLAEEDAEAYAAVVAARRLPRDSDGDREVRAAKLRRAMVAAAEAPLRTARTAEDVLRLARDVAPIGNPNAVSDAGVAAELAMASVRGAILNVRINLPYLDEEDPLRDSAPPELDRLAAQAEVLQQETAETMSWRMQPS